MHIVWNAFVKLVPYLGGRWTTFVATLFFIILVRIAIAFVFKIFRFNVDYKAPVKNTNYRQNTSSSHQVLSKVAKDTPWVE